jgi:hypothetical protein
MVVIMVCCAQKEGVIFMVRDMTPVNFWRELFLRARQWDDDRTAA